MSELQSFAMLSGIVLLIIICLSFWFALKTLMSEWRHNSKVE
jgi:hypothetical protein